MSRPLP